MTKKEAVSYITRNLIHNKGEPSLINTRFLIRLAGVHQLHCLNDDLVNEENSNGIQYRFLRVLTKRGLRNDSNVAIIRDGDIYVTIRGGMLLCETVLDAEAVAVKSYMVREALEELDLKHADIPEAHDRNIVSDIIFDLEDQILNIIGKLNWATTSTIVHELWNIGLSSSSTENVPKILEECCIREVLMYNEDTCEYTIVDT
jgi:hypothetical protein